MPSWYLRATGQSGVRFPGPTFRTWKRGSRGAVGDHLRASAIAPSARSLSFLQLRFAGQHRLSTMDANELKKIADEINETKRLETERKNAERVNEVLELCRVEANKGLYELTYGNSGLVPEVLTALRDKGLTVEDRTDRKHSRPHFSYKVGWGVSK